MEIWVKHILHTAENPIKKIHVQVELLWSVRLLQIKRRRFPDREQNEERGFRTIFSVAALENVLGNLFKKRTKPILRRDPNLRVR